MGAWDHGPFDNDTAADFAYEIRECSDMQARSALLLSTLRAAVALDVPPGMLNDDFEMDHRLEEAVAAAAFVADRHTGNSDFTDNPYARGVADDAELSLLPPVRLERPTPELLRAAAEALGTIVGYMIRDRVSDEWREPVSAIARRLV